MQSQYQDHEKNGYIYISPKAIDQLMELIDPYQEEMYKVGAVLELVNSLLSSPLHLEGLMDDCCLEIEPSYSGDWMLITLKREMEESIEYLFRTKFPYKVYEKVRLKLINPRSDKSSKERLEDLEKDRTWLILESVS